MSTIQVALIRCYLVADKDRHKIFQKEKKKKGPTLTVIEKLDHLMSPSIVSDSLNLVLLTSRPSNLWSWTLLSPTRLHLDHLFLFLPLLVLHLFRLLVLSHSPLALLSLPLISLTLIATASDCPCTPQLRPLILSWSTIFSSYLWSTIYWAPWPRRHSKPVCSHPRFFQQLSTTCDVHTHLLTQQSQFLAQQN